MKIILSGGGTLGPVTPLLALREIYLKAHPETKFIWVGTKNGLERELIEKIGLPFFTIAAGKLRRYFSVWNFFDFFKLIVGFFQAVVLVISEKPDLLVSAGGFVSVPLHWAGWFLGVPQIIHQQDAVPGLSNKLMAPLADKITVMLKDSLKFFNPKKTLWIGNPVRDLGGVSPAEGKKFFGFAPIDPVIFILGGGTGSLKLNQMTIEALPQWPKNFQVIHLIGRERPKELSVRAGDVFANYHVYEFFTEEMKYAYAAADVVVARAGVGTLSELASLRKAAVLLPKSGHQEENAAYLVKRGAVLSLNENADTGLKLAKITYDLIMNIDERKKMGEKLFDTLPPANHEELIKILDEVIAKK